MAQNIKPAAQKPEDPAVPKKSSKKIIIGAIASLLVVAAGGGGWYLSKDKNAAAQDKEVKVAAPKTPIFIALEPFTVNLLRETTDQYLQLGISFKTYESEIETKVKTSLPEIRSKILHQLTTKTASELATAAGKKKLAVEIQSLINTLIGIVNPPPAIAPPTAAPASTVLADAPASDAAEPALAPPSNPVLSVALEARGIVDVLFTSFIIQ